MAYSTSYATKYTPVDEVITESYRRIGIVGSVISGEQLDEARNSLNFMFASWVNPGLDLWLRQKFILPLVAGQSTYSLPEGGIDALEVTIANPTRMLGGTASTSASGTAANAFDGLLTTTCTQTSTDGIITYTFPTPTVINYALIYTYVQSTYSIAVQYSLDGTKWFDAAVIPTQVYNVDIPVTVCLKTPVKATYWRIKETGGATLNIAELYLMQDNTSRTITVISASEYQYFTNKGLISTPSSYWVNRQLETPAIVLWPAPVITNWPYLIYNVKMNYADINSFTDNFEVPKQYLDAVASGLTARLAEKFKPELYAEKQVIAESSYNKAVAQGTERVSYTFKPNLRFSGR